MNKYKAIGFDHTGVIIGVPATKFQKKISEILGVSVDDFHSAYLSHNTAFRLGEITNEERWRAILKDLDREKLYAKVTAYTNKPRNVNPKVIELIKELKAKGYKLGVLTNDFKEMSDPIRGEEHLDKLFDVICLAAETNLFKPDKEAFDDFLTKLNINADELVYIDDSESIAVKAQELGIFTILYTGLEDLRKQLQDRGILYK